LPDDDWAAGRQPESPSGHNGTGHRPPYPDVAVGRRSSYGFRGAGRRGAAVPQELLEGRTRQLSEFVMPAAVIVAGVLIVVAVALIINRALKSGDDNSIPLPQAPPVGSVPAEPSDQGVIPLPSPSPSTTPPTAPPTTPPARKTTPPPADGVRIVRAGVAPLVDLSAEGSRDWVHWGQESTFSLERDKDGKFAILEGAPTAPRFQHSLSPQRFSWRGGSPVDRSDGTTSGIRTCGKGNGFTISAPAGTSTRTLRLYVGVLAARGRLQASLTTGGATSVARLEQRGGSLDTAVFVLTYRAPRDGVLKVSWVTEESFSSNCGGVALEAASLR
jgi:hypothetical protein